MVVISQLLIADKMLTSHDATVTLEPSDSILDLSEDELNAALATINRRLASTE
jgi:hypothetical protein